MTPFDLFPSQVETVSVWKLGNPGSEMTLIAGQVRAIVKRQTQIDMTAVYEQRILTRRFHLHPADLPDMYSADPDLLLGYIIRTMEDRTFKITLASRGDDMLRGSTDFLSVEAQPYGRTSL